MRRLIVTVLVLVAGVAAFLLREQHAPVSVYVPPAPLVEARIQLVPVTQSGSAPERNTLIADPVLDANSALIYHVESGTELFAKNPDLRVPIASLTKVMSALVAQDAFAPDDIVTVSSGSVRVDGQKQTLYAGERLRVQDLVSMMLVESSNDAAYALAAYAKQENVDFVALMNTKAWVLGMRDCMFTDPAGLDDAAYCTARDLVRLARAALRNAPQIWPVMASPAIMVHSVDGTISHEVKTTDELLGTVPGIIGAKTGNTDGALGCLLLVVQSPDKRDTLISIVLGSRQRFADSAALVSWAWKAYRWLP